MFKSIKKKIRNFEFNKILDDFYTLGFNYVEDVDDFFSGCSPCEKVDHLFSKPVILENGKEFEHRLEFMTRSGGISMASYTHKDPDNPSTWFNYAYNLTFEEVQVCERMMSWLKKYHTWSSYNRKG